MKKAKKLAQKSGLSYRQLGVRMGYPSESARQSVWQFLHGTNPTIAKLQRFAKALGVNVGELL